MKNHFGRFALVLLICGLSAWAYLQKPPPLGLDLAGGASLTYEARVAADGGELTPERLNRAINVIESRLNATGMAEISITSTQQNEIVVELPGRRADQIGDIKSLIERNGRLEFRMEAEPEVVRHWREIDQASGGIAVLPDDLAWYEYKEGHGGPKMLVRTPERPLKLEMEKIDRHLKAGSTAYQESLAKHDAAAKDETVPRAEVERLRAESDALLAKLRTDSPEYRDAEAKYDEVVRNEVFTGDQLVKTEIHHQVAQIVVYFEFKPERKPYFGAFTERHVKESMAIILDGKVNSAPTIKSPLPGEGIIEGGGAAGFKEKDARDLAIVLESGSTGINLKLSREESLGPSLGEVAIRHGLWSVALGFVLVVCLMVFYYRLPGMVANAALLLNLIILMGVMAFFRAALTLPGIAGIVLTLGMAVDANILIFERYREERHRGKPVPEALAAGYDRALSAIIDTHATTILTAIVLIVMGTGSVKGFGVSLTVGLIASFFTAFFVTRWIFEWGLEKGIAKTLTLGPDKKTPTFDYMGKRKWLTGPSFVLMIAGVVVYVARDDYSKRDLEFVGGQEAIVHLAKAVTPDEADKRVRADKRYEDASIVTLEAEGVKADVGTTNRFRVRAKAASTHDGDAFLEYLSTTFKDILVSPPFSDVEITSLPAGGAKGTLTLHAVGSPGDLEKFKVALAGEGLSDVDAKADATDASAVHVTVTDTSPTASAETIRTKVSFAAKKTEPRIALSDPFPSKSFLEPSRAQDLYNSAAWAIFVSLFIEIVYIRLRYANFNYGVAAVVALAHDVPIALGAVTLCDSSGLVYAKVNLVLIAAFLTLIGYSMNDTIVVFDRIRENLGRSKVVLSTTVNDAVNQTIVRSIRTSMTVFIVVLVQFAFNWRTGSVLEGFSFVMTVGVISGTYSSIFIAAPLLLFLPSYKEKLFRRPAVTAAMFVATFAGMIIMSNAQQHGGLFFVGVAMAFNVPVHFLWYFFPWLGHKDPDEFVHAQAAQEEELLPVSKPGI